MDCITPVYEVHPEWGSDGGHLFVGINPLFVYEEYKEYVTLSVAKGLRRAAAGFFSRFAPSE